MLRQSPAPARGVGQGREQPDASNDSLRGRAARFVIVGGAMSIFYIGLTSLLALVGMPFQAALVVGFAAAVALHFTLQRVFVWSRRGRYALPIHHQLRRYLPLIGVQYSTTAGATAFLPAWLGLPVLAVYIGITLCYSVFNFLLFGARIFHTAESHPSDVQRL